VGATVEEIETVYRREFRRFVRVAAAVAGDDERGRDAVQEAFALALRHRRSFGRRGPLEAWLWRTTVNCALRAHRSREDAAEVVTSTNGVPAEEHEVRAAIALLPERQRLVLFLRYYADLDYAAIGDALGIAPGTVGATLNAAHARLREPLEALR
jgi:RNA polymerase sigma factor (sigma-70 family)